MNDTTPTKYVNAYDDILQMVASMEALDAQDERLASQLASGLNAERQAHSLSNIARLLVELLASQTNQKPSGVYAAIRSSVIDKIAGLDSKSPETE